MGQWVSPTSHSDPSADWTNESYAYDDDVATRPLTNLQASSWSGFLELNISAISCSKVKYFGDTDVDIDDIDVDVYYSSAWHNIYSGSYPHYQWVEKSLGGTYTVTKMRIRFHSTYGGEMWLLLLREAMFYREFILPTVTTQAVTDILSTTATGNGNITAIGSANATRRGFCYMVGDSGDPTTSDSVAYDDGDFGTGAYTKGLTGLSPGVTYRVRAYAINEAGTAYGTTVQFTTDKVAPTVTTQSPTNILPTTATGNGNITALGGENATVRGFKYGLTKVDTWSASDSGSFGLGAYTKGLTGLSANTTYWIRAYATNSIGTSYGAWVEFQTAASGTIPTGTDLFICADLSGYTFQLMRSETDDGETYTGYFVITTDLTNKQGLAFYKRILDLHLYFMSESSGTATIEVKRDNEASWQPVGSVALTGTEQIIVKHLAPDIRAKVFLFKISADNYFRFLGVLFEYLPEDLR